MSVGVACDCVLGVEIALAVGSAVVAESGRSCLESRLGAALIRVEKEGSEGDGFARTILSK